MIPLQDPLRMGAILVDLIVCDFARKTSHVHLGVLPQQFGKGRAVEGKY